MKSLNDRINEEVSRVWVMPDGDIAFHDETGLQLLADLKAALAVADTTEDNPHAD